MALDTLSPAEVAERLGISTRTVWRRIDEGALPAVHVASKPGLTPVTRIRVKDLEAFIKEQTNVA